MDLGEIFHLEWLQKYKNMNTEFFSSFEESFSTKENSKIFSKKKAIESIAIETKFLTLEKTLATKTIQQSLNLLSQVPSFLENYKVYFRIL